DPQPTAGADLNGYIAEYECRAGNPNCDVDVEGLTKQSCDVIVTTSDTNWNKITDNTNAQVFCIQSGDHTNKGTLELNFSGTANNRKILRYYSPSDDGLRPVDQVENERAIIRRIRMVSEDYWIFHRLTLDGKGGCGYALEPVWPWSSVSDHADHNIFDSLLVEDYKGEMFANPGNWNTLQRSVVRNSIGAPESEGVCLSESMCVAVGEGSHFRAVNNEIYDCQKNIAIGNGVQDHVGLIVENNDMYATPNIYSDCKGNYNGVGPCALTESLLNLKAGGSEAYPMKIFHNRLWGARRGDWSLGLTSGGDGEIMGIGGTGDPSEITPGHPGGDWVLLLNNIAFDASMGFGTTYPTPDNISLIGNIFYDMKTHGSQYDPEAPSTFNFYGHLGDGEIYLNTIVKGEEWIEGTLDGGDVRCNAIIGAGAASATNFGGSGFQIAQNAFYNTPAYNTGEGGDIIQSSAAESNNTDYCFYRKLLTNPEQVCIPYAKTTAQSPHYSQCTQGAGQRTGIGINDKIWTWADTLFGQ
ncbi:MAG: hypothetical protein NUV49_02550, partial [Patescibacteria group bacterium]|nr:hypothetical protein [Patescibacteria group bacterium]